MNMKKEDNPCKRDCPERSATCHIECAKYNEWHDKRSAELRDIYKKKDLERKMLDYEVSRKEKFKRRAGK